MSIVFFLIIESPAKNVCYQTQSSGMISNDTVSYQNTQNRINISFY